MIFFIDALRMLATILITNSHYVGVYPTDIIANGGLLGNVLFFAISGFCLSNIKLPFHKWYFKRVSRIYPIVIIMVAFNCLIGRYSFTTPFDYIKGFIYPTSYNFIGAIILLYIPYYFIVQCDNKFSTAKYSVSSIALALVFAIQLLIFIFAYDKSFYHIDAVVEPMINFLYFEAMLIGYTVKKNVSYFINKKGILKWFITAVLFVVYFVSKLAFSKLKALSSLQIINQYALLALMFGIFICVASVSGKLDRLPNKLKKSVSFIARITLELYVVQSLIIQTFKHLAFPLNWFVITGIILLSAIVLHYIIKLPSIVINKLNISKNSQ